MTSSISHTVPGATGGDRRAFATLDEIEAVAKAKLDPAVWDFLEGGAGEEQTLAANRAAFAQWTFRPRLLTGIGAPDLSTSFLGMPLSMPVLTAPFGTDGQFNHDGQLAVARANAGVGVISVVPEASSFSLEEVAGAAPAAARIVQLHPWGDPGGVLSMLDRARAAGYAAVCMTCDCPVPGWRERNLRNRYAVDVASISGNYSAAEAQLAEAFGQLLEGDGAQWTWDLLSEVMHKGGLPWVAKGVMTAEDATAAVAAGASAVLVSNHGGRQLDGVPGSLEQLPEIADALRGHSVQIAFDSGVRRGSDIVKAIALGADVVLIGRLAAYGLIAGGEAGVANVHALLREEIATIMTLAGRARISEVDRSLVQRARGTGQ